MKSSRKKPADSLLRQKKKEQERKNLYTILKTICGLSTYEDLLLLKEKNFSDLCGVSQVCWNLKEGSFIDPLLLKENYTSSHNSFRYCLSLPLEYKGWSGGELIFISNQKFTAGKQIFLKKVAVAVSSSIYFMEKRIKLENLKHQWNVAFDSFYRALCIADENYKILRANRSFGQLVGLPKKELLGQKVFKCLQVDHKEVKEAGFCLSHTINNRQLEIRSVPLNLEKDRFILLMASDITKENHLQEQLSGRARETELGFIRGSIAHELNNPLSGMKTLLHIMEVSQEEDSSSKEIIKEMQSAVDRCQKIIKTLLQARREPSETEVKISQGI